MASVQTSQIKLGKRHRKDMGDIDALAASIDAEGLLQPIGVMNDSTLVFGARRLQAVRDVLGWDRIQTVRVNVSSIAAGEFAENEMRKDFTVSERVAIAETIEAIERKAAKERQKEAGKSHGRGQKLPENSPEANGQETRDVVAKRSGLGSSATYRDAKKVVKDGSAALVEAMDAGEVSISAAAKLAALPKAKQTAAIKGGKATISQAAKPKPRYPASDAFRGIMDNILLLTVGFRNDYGTLAKAMKSNGWDPARTQSAKHSVTETIKDLKKILGDIK